MRMYASKAIAIMKKTIYRIISIVCRGDANNFCQRVGSTMGCAGTLFVISSPRTFTPPVLTAVVIFFAGEAAVTFGAIGFDGILGWKARGRGFAYTWATNIACFP